MAKKKTIFLSEPLRRFKIVSKKPVGSAPLKGYETRSVKVFAKGKKRFVKPKAGFILKKD